MHLFHPATYIMFFITYTLDYEVWCVRRGKNISYRYYYYLYTHIITNGETWRQAPNDVVVGGGGTGSKGPVSRNGWKRSVRCTGAVVWRIVNGPKRRRGRLTLRTGYVTTNTMCSLQCNNNNINIYYTICDISIIYLMTMLLSHPTWLYRTDLSLPVIVTAERRRRLNCTIMILYSEDFPTCGGYFYFVKNIFRL